MNMGNRIEAFTYNSSTMAAAEGTPVISGSPLSDTFGPLFTSTTFVSGSGSVQAYSQEGFGEITPYDTVISAVVDPSVGSINGDPRLTNIQGENATFSTVSSVMQKLDSTILPAAVLNIQDPPRQSAFPSGPIWGPPYETASYTYDSTKGISVTTTGLPAVGYFGFPRTTSQLHQLGNPSAQQFMTGYQMLPIAGTTSDIGTLMAPKTRQAPVLFALEGTFGGNMGMGSSQSYGSWVGMDTNAFMELNLDWDWTSAPGFAMDGGYIEKPDQDYQTFFVASYNVGMGVPYFSRVGNASYSSISTTQKYSSTVNFSPNRQVPSPILFGTLPSSMTTGWQTLAFAPNQASVMDGGTHAGLGLPATGGSVQQTANRGPYQLDSTHFVPDHLLLDLFWMPVAEPYPISEEFSTAGKISLNYQLMPFPYIQRKSGMDAVLKSVWIYAMPSTSGGPSAGSAPSYQQDYKSWYFMSNYATLPSTGTSPGRNSSNLVTRYPINVDETLKAFDYKFKSGDIFRSASQICDMYLYPNDRATPRTPLTTYNTNNNNANIIAWWKTNGMLTSDNGREGPYSAIYSRVTTQSNTYMVHWKVQTLHKLTTNGSTPSQWIEGADRVVSELRGATLIERYIDPNAGLTSGATGNAIPDYANPSAWAWGSAAGSSGPFPITYYYKWKVDNETYFQPPP